MISVVLNWYVKGAPSKLSLILDLTMKNLEAVIYFASYLVIDVDVEGKTAAIEGLEKQLTTKKEAAKAVSDKAIEEIPVQLNLFDIIYLDGKMLIDKPFKERRKIIEGHTL